MSRPLYLFDTNAVIEAVRTGAWNAISDRLISLERVADEVGARSAKRLRRQFTEAWLSGKRTAALLENP